VLKETLLLEVEESETYIEVEAGTVERLVSDKKQKKKPRRKKK
jgi:hypothetical protein